MRILLICLFTIISLTFADGSPVDNKVDTIGQYEILGTLGSGSFGKVYQAKDTKTGKLFAIKQTTSNPKARNFAMMEGRILSDAQGTGIIRIFGHFECGNGQYCILLEALSGDLLQFNRQIRSLPDMDRLRHVQAIARDLVAALALLAKKKIVHADIKPENILYDEKFNQFKMADFGLSFRYKSDLNRIRGTSAYIAPEVYAYGQLSPASDMWSLGVLLLGSFVKFNPFSTNGQGVAKSKSVIALKWEEWLGTIPLNLRDRLIKQNFKVTSDRALLLDPLLFTMLKGEKFKHFLNFIQRSLDYNPKERMTAKHALQHPFLRYDIQADGEQSWIKRLFGFG